MIGQAGSFALYVVPLHLLYDRFFFGGVGFDRGLLDILHLLSPSSITLDIYIYSGISRITRFLLFMRLAT